MKRLIGGAIVAGLLLAVVICWGQARGGGRLYADYPQAERVNEFVQTLDWWSEDDPLTICNTVNYGQIVCVVVREGEPIMGVDHLLAFFPNGRAVELASAWCIEELRAADGRCYYLSRLMGFGDQFQIYTVDFQTQTVTLLGDKDFIYNCPIIYDGLYVIGGRDDPFTPWEVRDDGVYAIGFSRLALADNVVADEELAAATYGLWRLDKNGAGQQLVERWELPPKEQGAY